MSEPFILLAISASTAVFSVLAATLLLTRFGRHKTQHADADLRAVFLFEGDDLIDASPSAEHILAEAPRADTDWGRTLAALSPRFPRLAGAIGRVGEIGTLSLRSDEGGSQLVAELIDGRLRITVSEIASGPSEVRLNPGIFRGMLRELDLLRSVSSRIPFPVWRQTSNGEITWANQAYSELAEQVPSDDDAPAWPPKQVFSEDSIKELSNELGCRRLPFRPNASEDDTWYECRSTAFDDEILMTAVNIDATVEAEKQLREFMQTLTKTFSHLTTGLAIFDRHRRLALFNPALTDLTGLPSDFLAARPTLYTLLDRLRDRRMIPEPKDYGSWRSEIAQLEAAAVDGTYSETWSLPDNRTYRVSGRPHPGGALAFLMEDISAEMSMTRRFRSELELGQAVIDTLDHAIVVFSPSGVLSMVNQAYQVMWDSDIADTVDVPTITEVTRLWMAKACATPFLGEIRDFVLHASERSAWQDNIEMRDGSRLRCEVLPLSGGSTMVRFSELDETPLSVEEVKAAS